VRIVRILLVTGLLLAGGCATTAAFMMRRDGNADVLYPATLLDVGVACGSVFGSAPSGPSMDIFSGNLLFFPLAIVDLPVSLFSDTLMLPFDVYRIFISPEGRLPFVLVVRDDEGEPVSDAAIKGYGGGAIAGRTREDGSCVLWRGIRRQGHYNVTKTGYYSSNGSVQYNNDDIAAMAAIARTPPKTMFINVTLRRIKNPIPMYVKRVNLGMPAMEQQVGYDLMVGDWVGPYGKGVISDFVFKAELNNVVPVGSKHPDEFDYQLTISFSNEKDGLQKMVRTASSRLGSEHEAPADNYLAEWVQTRNRRKGKPEETNIDFKSEYGYYCRVRTKLDEEGKIIETMYGKIYGDFLAFTYYLNPTPNDRNVEFDPKKNLFKNLSSLEEVSAP